MSDKKIKVGIIGCGNIHELHIKAIQENENCELVAVCDIIRARAEKTAEKHGVPNVFIDYKEMLDSQILDCVHITTPHFLHAKMSIEAMNAGLDVLCEKPVATKLADAIKIQQAQLQTGRKFAVCFQNRYNTTSQKMRELIDSGEAGEIEGSCADVQWNRNKVYYDSGEWRGTWECEGGGVLINQAIHTMDLQLWLAGMPKSLYGRWMNSLLSMCIEVEDTAMAAFEYEDVAKRSTFFATNCAVSDFPVRLDIVCSNLTMTLAGDLTIQYKDGRKEIVEETRLTGEKAYWGYGHKLLIDDFYNSVINNKDFPIGVEAGINTLKIINAIYQSQKTGQKSEI